MKYFIAALLCIGSAFASDSKDNRFTYRYELKATGTAPTLLSIEGWNADLAKDCKTEDDLVTCAGTLKALTITPHGDVYLRGPVASDNVTLKIYQRCGKNSEQEVTGLPTDPIRSNWLDGLFYLTLEALLNPCGL